MIPVQELLIGIDLKLNKLGVQQHQYIPTDEKILFLNEAQLRLVKSKVDSNNKFGTGLDGFKKRYEDIQTLINDYIPLPSTKAEKLYPAYKASLPEDHFLSLQHSGICSKGECKGRTVVSTRTVKHGDLPTIYKNSHWVPSFEYQETISQISKDELILYTDGTFSIEEIYISYVRYPLKIDVDGYEHLDGTDSINQDCELDYQLKDELLEFTILELGLDTENQTIIQTSELRSKNTD